MNPVCSPNRATLLTGLLPSQHGVHDWLGHEEPDAQMGPQAYCTIEEFPTLPGILASEGYDCGMCGKWHLGDSLKPQLGFRYWFAKPKGHTRTFYGEEAIWEGEVYQEKRYYLEAITDHAVAFLRQSRKNPFFLYVGYNAPYGLDQDLRTGHRNRHTEYYAHKRLPCFPRQDTHPWLVYNRDCIGNETAMRSYACAVSGVDDGIGAILEELLDSGLEKNTLVVFTADHGLCAGHHGMWGMGDHSRPRHMFQENLRVPLIFRHPAGIPPGEIADVKTCNYDFFPTLLSYFGVSDRLPDGVSLPGKSYAPILLGKEVDGELNQGGEMMFHEYENTRTVQTRIHKLVLRHPAGPNELYDLAADPGERCNLIDDTGYIDTRENFTAELDVFFRRYADSRYDLWSNGRSKAEGILDNTGL